MMTKRGPESMPEKAVFDKGKAATDAADTLTDKWFSHNAPPFCRTVAQSLPGRYRVLLCKIYYPGDIGMILTANASFFTPVASRGQMNNSLLNRVKMTLTRLSLQDLAGTRPASAAGGYYDDNTWNASADSAASSPGFSVSRPSGYLVCQPDNPDRCAVFPAATYFSSPAGTACHRSSADA